MTIGKTLLLALGGAAVVESFFWMACIIFSNPGVAGSDYPGTIFAYWHTIGFMVAAKTRNLSNLPVIVTVAVSGVAQFFVILLGVLMAVRRKTAGSAKDTPDA